MAKAPAGEYAILKYSTIDRMDKLGIKNGHEIILYSIIEGLAQRNGKCVATNEYFAKILKCTERSIQTHLCSLKKCGLIKVYYETTTRGTIRVIYPQKYG